MKSRSCTVPAESRHRFSRRTEGARGDKGRWRIFYAQQHSVALTDTRPLAESLLLRLGLIAVGFALDKVHIQRSTGMDSFIIAALAVCSLTAPAFGDKAISKARSCSDIKVFYSGKGFSLDGVPHSEISGKIRHLSAALMFIFLS